MIPMLDLKLQYNTLQTEIDTAVADVLQNTHFIMGPNVKQFETEAATYLGVKHAISCNSGTDALHLALRACGISEGDEVITTPFTFAATVEAICYLGATPVFVDIDPITLNLTLENVEEAINETTRAILTVHIFGQIADIQALCSLAKKHKLYVIEDCAQSFGASVKNESGQKQTGSFGDAGCFSFFPSKNLGCYGDGGLFTTNSDELAENFNLLKAHGSKIRNQHEIVGWNSRLDEIQAAILRIKLKHIDEFNRRRITVAEKYAQLLGELPLQLPIAKYQNIDSPEHVFHQYTLLSDQRDSIDKQLSENNIGHAIYYPMPLSDQPAYSSLCKKSDLSITNQVCERCISLPMFPEMSDQQIDIVANTIKQVYT